MMISIWSVVGLLVLAACSGVAAAAAMVLLGVQGVMVALTKRLEIVEISAENLDRRLTTEVRARAAVKGVEARQERKSVEDEARVRLAGENAPSGSARPSILDLVRR